MCYGSLVAGPATCSTCGTELDDLDRLLAPVEPRTGSRGCPACLDDAAGPAGRAPMKPPGPDPRAGGAVSSDGTAVIGVRELRNQVAAVIRRASAGERLVVTVDGHPMAQIGPLASPGAPTLADLAAGGLIEPPRTPTPPTAPEPEDLPVDVRIDLVLRDLRGR
jgi:prevent-host-death family protein